MNKIKLEGKVIGIGDIVSFKFDVEQEGVIVKIENKENKTILHLRTNGCSFAMGILIADKKIEMPLEKCFLLNDYETLLEREEKENKRKSEKSIFINGKDLFIGDKINFKAGEEMTGTIKDMIVSNGEVFLTIEDKEGFYGGYMEGETETEERLSNCWV